MAAGYGYDIPMAWRKMLLEMPCAVAGLAAVAFCTGLPSCASPDGKPDEAASTKETKEGDAVSATSKGAGSSPVDVSFLLSMTYDEAQKISPASAEVLPNYRVAADKINVTSKTDDGRPRRASAKGHVFLQIDFGDQLIALGQEAVLGGHEVILRGKPLLKRGRTVVEGLEDTTVFFIMGLRLQVVGKHRITIDKEVTPTWPNSWKEGPNPLLPALSPNDFPKEMRASPLLPRLDDDDDPSKIPR